MSLTKLKIKKGDRVRVIAGKELDKEGKVFMVFPVRNRLLIEKLNLIVYCPSFLIVSSVLFDN